MPANFRLPFIQSWSASFQRQVFENFMVDVAYAGKQSVGLMMTTQANPPIYIPGTNAAGQPLSTRDNINARRLYAPTFGPIRDVTASGRSNFHSLQLTSRYRYRHGLLFNVAYTWSKSLDTISTINAGNFPQDPFDNLRGSRGYSDFDVPHVFAVSWVYEIPNPLLGTSLSFLKPIIGGWQLSGLTRLNSGTPYSIMSGTNNSFNGENQDRADVVGDPWAISNDRPRGERILRWFNTPAFVPNPIGRVGNSARNMMRGPAQLNTDFAVLKNFPISERWGRLQFRAEFFNVFNQVRFGNPNNVATSGAFGRISSAADPRLIQLALKFMF